MSLIAKLSSIHLPSEGRVIPAPDGDACNTSLRKSLLPSEGKVTPSPNLDAYHAPLRKIRAFSLVELLVAISVLALMMVLLAQMLGTMSNAWQDGQRRVDNFTKARAMLDLIALDLQQGLFRPDLAAFPKGASPILTPIDYIFYTRRPGVPTSGDTAPLRDLSLVRYQLDTTTVDSVLKRSDLPIKWDSVPRDFITFGETAKLPAALTQANSFTARETAPGVIGFAIRFLYADGKIDDVYTYSTTNRVLSVGVSLVVVDDQSLLQLKSLNKVEELRDLFTAKAETSTGQESPVLAIWEAYLLGKGSSDKFPWKEYPKSLAVGLKTFERYVAITQQ